MIGDNIRYYRKTNNMSQDELADKLNVTRQSISLWETGQTQPSLEYIITMARLFGISTDALLMSEPAEEPAAVFEKPAQPPVPQKKSRKPLIIGIIAAVVIIAAALALILSGGEADPGETKPPLQTETPAPTPVPADPQKLYDYIKAYVVEKGVVNGDFCCYSNNAELFGGMPEDTFNLFYWGDTDTVDFTYYHSFDDTYAITFYLHIPKTFTGNYEYCASYFYRSNGIAVYESSGTIHAAEFTENYPLQCSEYLGDTANQDDFMELSRLGMCQLLNCLKQFTVLENLDYSFTDFGFLIF
ncbi:MAG: helix-turn-helix transcriptional regulator [Oscillospiraceae bacterium]|nr:helix-turn-helix transcriptional regulator [Oscillospiraceae bacterium]